MRKRFFVSVAMIAVIILSMTIGSTVFADENITVKLNGQTLNFDVPPQLINGRTMVPMRTIFENLGASVSWDEATQTVTSVKDTVTISLTIGVPSVVINGDAKSIDIAPCVINGRTLVPVRAISEAFKLNVGWDEAANTVIINNPVDDLYIEAPKYITDFYVNYISENNMFSVYFGFKNANYQYVKYNGFAKVVFENENGENIYSKEHYVDESMFGTYTRVITGNTQYLLCKIDIPVSQMKKGRNECGTVTLEFYNDDVTYGLLKVACYNLPILSGAELADISYDKSFALTKYHSSGRVWRTTNITAFEITDIEVGYNDELKVSFRVTGTVNGSNYCSFSVKCYDADGFVIGAGTVFEKVSDGETFRFKDYFYIPNGTVQIEFADE